MSSNTPYGTGPFERNQRLTAKHLETLRDATAGNVQLRNPDNFVKRIGGGHILTSKRRNKTNNGTSLFILKITAPGVDVNTYTASTIDNRTDQTVIEAGVTLKALDHDAGTIPNGVILTCSYDKVNEFYEPTNYSVFYGS
jgi:hypothetical protein